MLENKSYQELAQLVLGYFFQNFTEEERYDLVNSAYNSATFVNPGIVPLHSIDTNISVAELFHGRTLAFKDLALSLFPHLLIAAKEQEKEQREILILTATSGDTGKAALEGFKDVKGTNIMVFYPSEGVSPMQAEQMQKQEGQNVKVVAIRGNFDDAQRFLKQVFTSEEVNAYAEQHDVLFSSANSINIGRLLPQVVYYVAIYAKLVENGSITDGEAFDVVVPTGNFGNILAAYFAKKMGIPIHQLICASNKNKVLADFFESGVYDMNRDFYTTASPSMDIVESSNFERFLYYVAKEDGKKVSQWVQSLRTTGKLAVNPEELAALQEDFCGEWVDDEETQAVIAQVYNTYGYLLDPHTAVAFSVYLKRAAKQTGKIYHTVVMATAHPFKFPPVVGASLELAQQSSPYAMLDAIQACTGITVPVNLASLQEKPLRFTEVIDKELMKQAVLKFVDEVAKK